MKNLIGKRYGRLTVIENTGKKAHSRENIYLCQSDWYKLLIHSAELK